MARIDTDKILDYLREAVEKKVQLSAEEWMKAALGLNQLLSYEHDALIDAEQAVAAKKLAIMQSQDKRNIAAVNVEVEASETFAEMRRQRFRVERIEECIRLAKKYSDINSY
jgi:hypothetical protein